MSEKIDLDDLTPAMMQDEIKSVILEKRDLLQSSIAKKRMKEMVDITRLRLATLERIWLFLKPIAEGRMILVPASPESPPAPADDDLDDALPDDDLDDSLPD